jgi:negative regulator of flagellin synthesis FlgM
MAQLANGIGSLQNLPGSLAVGGSTTAVPNKAVNGRTGSVPAQKTDQASLSAAGAFASRTSGESEVRLAKVAGLQQAIANGTYHVSSSDVAGKIIDSLLG